MRGLENPVERVVRHLGETGTTFSMIYIPEEFHARAKSIMDEKWQQSRIDAKKAANEIAKLNKQDHKSVEGLGELTARIPGVAYHFWGQKLGYDCWKDQEFLREFLRDNPECKVNSKGTKLQVGYGS
jgi:hypothetical protein